MPGPSATWQTVRLTQNQVNQAWTVEHQSMSVKHDLPGTNQMVNRP